MQTIQLPGGGRATTQLGYGCSTLMGALGMKESLRLLEAAYEAGIRHYDTAPLYGYGQSEKCVGEFRRRHPDVTVATKYGIPPSKNAGLLRRLRGLAGPVIRSLPMLKKSLQKAASSVTVEAPKATFTAEQAQASLEHSLRELQTDCIDLWLLHEVDPKDVGDEGLLRCFEKAKADGKVGAFGAAVLRQKLEEMQGTRPAFSKVLQYEWSMFDEEMVNPSSLRIYFRVLRDNFEVLQAAFGKLPEACARWSQEVNADLGDARVLASLVLKASMVSNPGSIVLVSTKNLEHLKQNVAVTNDDSLVASATLLSTLARREGRALAESAGLL
jgi:D-threo-aldose 1-dehydrogenase